MIQHTSARQSSTAIAPYRQAPPDSPEHWGHWSGHKHYALEVVQHPLRARMCGFGDKDRRPLAPAAVAKMIVTREDNSQVDVDEIDCSFFLVIVDLWSADGKHEMNLVAHPSSADRYVPTNSTKSRRRGTSSSAPHGRSSGNETPVSRSTPTPQHRSDQGSTGTAATTPMVQPQTPTYSAQQGYFPPQPAPMPEAVAFPSSTPYGVPHDAPPTWGYPPQAQSVDRNTTFPPPILPSIHTFGRTSAPISNSVSGTSEGWQPETEAEILPYRAWNPEGAYAPVDNYPNSQVDAGLRPAAPSGDNREGTSWTNQDGNSRAHYTQDGYPSAPHTQPENSMYANSQYAQPPAPSPYYTTSYPPTAPNSAPTPLAASMSAIHSIPRHTYTRTLVGPLSANACRLSDEHRKTGIFFLFQDLSVRTEGTFRLRLRLMNVGAPPAPEAGALRVHNDVSPVLAQTFTEPFVVFSAKRFPGVPDTTALSIAFGNQGQKLPLRNRHGSNKRRRRDDSGSDDDSDGG